MRVLAIETASEACSVALFENEALVASDHRVLGRGHAEALVPMIGALPNKGRADRILVSLGPGSFTGVRIGIAAARALGVAWGAQVSGYPTLALVAAIARTDAGLPKDALQITVCMNGGHGEWFVQSFDDQGRPEGAFESLKPEEAINHPPNCGIAGNRANELAALMFDEVFQPFECLPDASYVLTLPPSLLSSNVAPIYGRPPDAKPQSNRPSANTQTSVS